MSSIVGQKYLELLQKETANCHLYSLEDLPAHFMEQEMYGQRSEAFEAVLQKYVAGADKFVFVIPEYNGGFPGVLKTFIDSFPPAYLHHKKAALVGLSSGATGALRGMDQFGNVLNYLKVNVHFHRPKLSKIGANIENGALVGERALNELATQAKEIVAF